MGPYAHTCNRNPLFSTPVSSPSKQYGGNAVAASSGPWEGAQKACPWTADEAEAWASWAGPAAAGIQLAVSLFFDPDAESPGFEMPGQGRNRALDPRVSGFADQAGGGEVAGHGEFDWQGKLKK